MTAKEHLKEMHTSRAEFHVKAAKSHAKIAKCFSKMDVEGAADLSAAHEELATAHTEAAENCVQCVKSLDAANKAMMGDDEDRFLGPGFPTGITSVYKVDNLRAVPRFGAPPMGELSAVDPALTKVLGLDGEDE